MEKKCQNQALIAFLEPMYEIIKKYYPNEKKTQNESDDIDLSGFL